MLDTCKELEIMGIVSLQNFIFDPASSLNMKLPLVWNDPSTLNHIKSTIEELVIHLSSRGDELVAYSFISEPVIVENGVSRNPEAWPVLALEISQIIDTYDNGRWRIATNGPWGLANSFRNFSPLPYEKTI